MKKTLQLVLIIFSLIACGQEEVKTPENAMSLFENFKSKEKFIEDNTIFYPGISDEEIRPVLTEKINKAADDFNELFNSESPTDKEYQKVIEIGLTRFSTVYLGLDTEDRERVCGYFEELMDIVGLESSGGHLNNFMYGFELNEL